MTTPTAGFTAKQHAALTDARTALTAVIVDPAFKKLNQADRQSVSHAWRALEVIIERALNPLNEVAS